MGREYAIVHFSILAWIVVDPLERMQDVFDAWITISCWTI